MRNIRRYLTVLTKIALLLLCTSSMGSVRVPAGATIIMGQSGVYSGPLGAFAQDNINVINTYFELINARGGVHGRKLKLIALDDGFDPKRTVENVRRLIEKEKVFALFNVIGTANNAAIYPLLAQHGIALVGPYTGAAALRDLSRFRHLFFTRASYADETDKMVEHLVATGYREIAIVYQDDPFGQAGLHAATEALAKRKLKPAAIGRFEIAKLEQTATAAAQIVGAKAPAVIIASSGKGTTTFVREVLKRGHRPSFFCLSVTNPRQLWADLDADARGIIVAQTVPSPWRSSLPLVREYQDVLARLNSREISYGSMEGFVAARVVVEALRRAGPDLTRERYFAALENMRNVDLGGFEVNYGPNSHVGSTYVDLSIIGRDGRFVR